MPASGAQIVKPRDQVTPITGIRPNLLQAPVRRPQPEEQWFGSVAILFTGGMHMHFQQQAKCIDEQMPFSAVYFLARIVAARSPFSVVLTVWLSKIAALASGCRPSAWRSWRRKRL